MPNQTPSAVAPDRLIRLPEILNRVGLSRTTIWRKIARGTFPAAIQIGDNAVAWRESDLLAWMASLPTRSRALPTAKAEHPVQQARRERVALALDKLDQGVCVCDLTIHDIDGIIAALLGDEAIRDGKK